MDLTDNYYRYGCFFARNYIASSRKSYTLCLAFYIFPFCTPRRRRPLTKEICNLSPIALWTDTFWTDFDRCHGEENLPRSVVWPQESTWYWYFCCWTLIHSRYSRQKKKLLLFYGFNPIKQLFLCRAVLRLTVQSEKKMLLPRLNNNWKLIFTNQTS